DRVGQAGARGEGRLGAGGRGLRERPTARALRVPRPGARARPAGCGTLGRAGAACAGTQGRPPVTETMADTPVAPVVATDGLVAENLVRYYGKWQVVK